MSPNEGPSLKMLNPCSYNDFQNMTSSPLYEEKKKEYPPYQAKGHLNS